jgi:arylformamidase
MTNPRRVQFDLDIEFLNGGGLQGQQFRLDIDGDDIDDSTLAEYIVRDLRLLMVGQVRISNKQILIEPHKRPVAAPSGVAQPTLIDLSHTIEDGMITYKGLPAPIVCDHWTREQSATLTIRTGRCIRRCSVPAFRSSSICAGSVSCR